MTGNPSLWKRWRFRLETLGVALAVKVVPSFSRKALLRVASSMGRLAYLFDGRGRKVAKENLQAAFPDQERKERGRIIRRAYFHQTMSSLDLVWAQRNLSRESLRQLVRCTFEDQADFDDIGDRGVIWVTPHFGTFEWLSIELALTQPTQLMIVARDFHNPGLTPIFTRLRQHSGVMVVPPERAMTRLLKHVKRGGQTAFLTDLRVKPSKAATIIECFGLKACVTILHAFLARQTGAPIIPFISLPQEDGSYVIHFHRRLTIAEDASPQAIAQQCWDVFERTIRQRPAPWLWMYKHWRYLPAASDGRHYPAYASASRAFAQMEASFSQSP